MCGFVAICAYSPDSPPIDEAELVAIRDAMVTRGPDAAGLRVLADGRLGFGHRRLSIIDTSDAGAQPMFSTDGRLCIVFNGEIYNFAELRQELEQNGASFRTRTDTEVILELYRRHGEGMLTRLRGMFALALWDADRTGMLLARDGFGIKPLYVADDGRTLRAASQVKALLAGGRVDVAADAAGHASFFLWGHVAEPFTLYTGIRALPAGSGLWLGMDGSRREFRFFDLNAVLADAARSDMPFDPAGLSAALRDSVAAHMIADVPLGVFLSGGLDSTTLAALAAGQSVQPLKTVTLGFSEFAGTANDEVPLAEGVAGLYGTDHHTCMVSAGDFAGNRASILNAMDQPSVDGVNTWFVSRAASARGLKVALSGLGGDEIFGGYNTFSQVPHLVRRLAPLGCVPFLGRGFRLATAAWIGRFTSPKAAGILEYGTRPGDAYLLRRGLFMPWELPAVMGADMAREGWRRLAMGDRLAVAVDGLPLGRLMVTALEAGFYMRNQLLRDSDWAGMAHSLEIRVPLVDSELYARLLPMMAGRRPPTKRDMAICARPALPDAVLNRPKTGFFIPVADWIRGGAAASRPGLRGWARDVYRHFQPEAPL